MRLCLIAPIPPPYGGIANWTRLISEHIEKKQLDILANEPMVDDIKDTQRDLRIIFTKAWSSQIDGVRLFEQMNKLSRSIALRYREGRVILSIPKSKKQLELSILALMASKKISQSNEV